MKNERALTPDEVAEIEAAKDLIRFYKAAIRHQECRIQNIVDRPSMEYMEWLVSQPLPEF